jgi:hypothetical protein
MVQVRDCAFTILPRAWCCSCREAPPGASACCLAARILVMLQCCTSGCVQIQLCATWHVLVSTRCVVCPACAVASCVLHPHKDGCHLEECVASCTAPWVLRAVGTSTSLDCGTRQLLRLYDHPLCPTLLQKLAARTGQAVCMLCIV